MAKTNSSRRSDLSSSSSSFDSSMSSSFSSSKSSGYLNRSSSTTRVNLNRFAPLSLSIRIKIDRSSSSGRPITLSSRDHIVRKQNNNHPLMNMPKRTLNARRSAMANSLIRIGTVEGDLVKRTLSQLIRPSSHSLRRRNDFRPKLSRLFVMLMADESL
ncbi:uncharacterized protein LOC124943041 [Impatiens glandulifera]|uniref:uncharacterized protein LOC124943041 n=1 Tax=Impatiens glandulifera TaxID=253017 RepID=UPI001FB0945F|nr:uncharacterized protein LOC124943041 [Impatiens glandulifera]